MDCLGTANIVKRKLKPKMGEEIMREHASPVNEPKFLAPNELQRRALKKMCEWVYPPKWRDLMVEEGR